MENESELVFNEADDFSEKLQAQAGLELKTIQEQFWHSTNWAINLYQS